MTAAEILAEIEPLGAESYRKVLRNHGVPEPMFGVKIEALKKIQKRIKMDYQLALDLFDTGIYDAQYLAGLIADDAKMSKADLNRWAEKANCSTLSENTVPWVAAEGRFGRELALEWIDSDRENVAIAGWATLITLVSIKDDSELDIEELAGLLHRVQMTIHQQPNRLRYIMNGFVSAVGGYVVGLTALAIDTAVQIGKVTVDMGATACAVRYPPDVIEAMKQRGTLGKKRKTAKC
jgi:hypothetical protein